MWDEAERSTGRLNVSDAITLWIGLENALSVVLVGFCMVSRGYG